MNKKQLNIIEQYKLNKSMNRPLRVLELFGGIGAIRKALEIIKKQYGIDYEVVDYVEIDKFAVKSYNAIYETNFEPQDITKYDKDIEVDLVMHGSCCQDLSTAGKGQGADEGSGTRSALMYDTLRILKKMSHKPQFVIWENVTGLLSEKHEHNFKIYLKNMRELGYKNYSKVLFAKDYGLAQRRPRSFVVSIFEGGEFKFPKKKFLDHSFREYLVDEYSEKSVLKENHRKRIQGLEECEVTYNFAGKIVTDKVFPTITRCYRKANGNGGTILCENGDYRTLEPIERWRLQGFSDIDFYKAAKVNSDTQLNYQAGNSIAVSVLVELLKSLFGIEDTKYRLYRHHFIIDDIEQALLTTKDKAFDEQGNPYSEILTEKGTIIIKINNFQKLARKYLSKTRTKKGIVKPATIRIFKMCLIEVIEKNCKTNLDEQFTAKTARSIDIDTKEFVKTLGRNKKSLYFVNAEIKEAIDFLKNVSIEFKSTKIKDKNGNDKNLVITGICKSTTKLENYKSKLHFVLNNILNNLIFEEGIDISIPVELLQINAGDHPHSWFLFNKINQEMGTNKEVKIKVKDLLMNCPTLPQYAEELGYNETAKKRKVLEDELNDDQLIIKKDRNPYQHIIVPFERDLNVIREYKWKYKSTDTNHWKQAGANDRRKFKEFQEDYIIFTKRKRLRFRASKLRNSKFIRCKKIKISCAS